MRVKVHSVDPPTGSAEIEEFVVEIPPDADPGIPARADEPAPIVTERAHRRVTAADLGPNGDRVADLLERAARLTRAECRRLDEEAGWRWGPVIPLPGASVAGALGAALVRGRAQGRADAIVALGAGVRAVILENDAARSGGSRVRAAIANAGLAVLVRDLIEPEMFETLFGPWREVMHR